MVGTGLGELLLEDMLQAERHVGIFAGIVADGLGGEVAHRLLPTASGADELLYLDGVVLEVHLGQVVHAVTELGLQQVVGYHGVEHRSAQFHAVVLHHKVVILDVLSYLEALLIGEYGAECLHYLLRLAPLGRHRHIVGLTLGDSKAHAHKFRHDGVGARSLGIEGKGLCHGEFFHDFIAFFGGVDEGIGMGDRVQCAKTWPPSNPPKGGRIVGK